MAIIVVCGLMLIAGIAVTVRWFGMPIGAPPADVDGTAGRAALRVLWWTALAFAAGATTGLLIVGAGGRLAMRLLAVTAGSGAEGLSTEAEEIVGEITFGGTLGFMLFVGIGAGVFSAVLYAVVQRFLPGGRMRGLWFGALLLVLLATRIEPLRTNNEDFDLVGPAWLAITLFSTLALAQGIAVATVMNRWSHTQPMLNRSRRAFRYLPVVPFLLLPFIDIMLFVVILVAIGIEKYGSRLSQSSVVTTVGRVVLGVVVLVVLPGFVSSIADIAERSP